MFEPLLSPLFSSLFSPLIAAAQRIFIKLNGVDEYFTFQNTKTFPDDFDLSIDAVLPTAATTVTLFGQTASADHYIKVLSTGFVSINIDTSIVTSTVLATKDSKQRRYGVRVVGDDFIFTEDGATIDTVTDAVAAAKSLIINVIAQSNGADFFNNKLSDPILTDLTTASNSVFWQLNRAFPANTEQSTDSTNLLTYVNIVADARELYTFNQSENRWDTKTIIENGNFSNGLTGWLAGSEVSSVDNTAFVDGSQLGFRSIAQNFSLRVGDRLLITLEITTVTAGVVRILAGNTDYIDDFVSTPQVLTETVTVISSPVDFGARYDSNFIGTVDNSSVKKIIQIA